MEEFLRAAEPPSHNDWTHATARLRAEYRQGSQTRLNNLWRELENRIVDIFEEDIELERGPARLAELFPFSAQAESKHNGRGKFHIDDLDARLEDGVWSLSGRVIRIASDDGSWSFTVVTRLDAETGLGEVITIADLRTDHGELYRTQNGWQCDVPSEIEEVSFVGFADSQEPGNMDLHRTRLRLYVAARRGES